MLVRVTSTAQAQLETIDTWWREHRRASRLLFCEELADALDLIAALPLAGRRYRSLRSGEVRRILLRSSRFHVYYGIDEDHVVVLAVWSALRGHGPPLPGARP